MALILILLNIHNLSFQNLSYGEDLCVGLTPPITISGILEYTHRCDIKSLNDLLPHLPKEFRSNFTFAHTSRSPEARSIDYQNPRLLQFSPESDMVIASTTNPNTPDYHNLQIQKFDWDTGEWEFNQLMFDPLAKKHPTLYTSEQVKQYCTSCHGARLHPIWDLYPDWRGFYGRHDDQIIGGVKIPNELRWTSTVESIDEADEYIRMRLLQQGTPRLQGLEFGAEAIGPYSKDFKTTDPRRRPNLKLSELFEEQQLRRLFLDVKKRPEFLKLVYETINLAGKCYIKIDPAILEDALGTNKQFNKILEKVFGPNLNQEYALTRFGELPRGPMALHPHTGVTRDKIADYLFGISGGHPRSYFIGNLLKEGETQGIKSVQNFLHTTRWSDYSSSKRLHPEFIDREDVNLDPKDCEKVKEFLEKMKPKKSIADCIKSVFARK